MGLAASQGKLLFMTARLSNNEFEQQSVAYSKQRLANSSEQINDEYLAALEKTKYQVLTGYNGTEATYEDLTYNMITGMDKVALGKQYLVKDNKGKVVVSNEIAKAFEKGNGDFNVFLANVGVGYTMSDIDVANDSASLTAIHEAWDKYLHAVGRSIDDENGEHILEFGFNSVISDAAGKDNNGNANAYEGYVTYDSAYITHPISKTNDESYQYLNLYKEHNFTYNNKGEIIGDNPKYYVNNYVLFPKEFTDENGETNAYLCYQTQEQTKNDEYTIIGKELDSYDSKTGKYKCKFGENTYEELYVVLNPYKSDEVYLTEDSRSYLEDNYLTFTDAESGVKSKVEDKYELFENSKPITYEGTTKDHRELYDYAVSITAAYANRSNPNYKKLTHDNSATNYYKNIFNEMKANGYTIPRDEANLKDTNWFVNQLKAGKITLSYYSNIENKFIGTSLDDDESITEKEDKSAIAVAEQNYTTRMNRIESQDKQFDMELNKLEAEHSALTTEYDAVVKVISKNVEKSFNTFS